MYLPSLEDICTCDLEVRATSWKLALCPTFIHHRQPLQESHMQTQQEGEEEGEEEETEGLDPTRPFFSPLFLGVM